MKKLMLGALAAVAMSVGQVALAAPIVAGQWYEFLWSGSAPATAQACAGGCTPLLGAIDAPADPPWTITTASGSTVIRITDAFVSQDVFQVFDFGVSLGNTSAPTPGGSCGPSVDDCFADADYSHGTFSLGAGPHEITIETVAGSLSGGAAFFRVDVPAPGTLALLGLGLAGLALRRKRA